MIDTSHIPGVFAGGFIIPGANGLPDLYVNATDPANWVSMQVAARQPAARQPAQGKADPQGNILPDGTTPGTSMTEWLSGTAFKDTVHGFAVAFGGVILGVLLIILGAYQLTKD